MLAYITLSGPLILILLYMWFDLQAVIIAVLIPAVMGLIYCMLRLNKFISFEPPQLFLLIAVYILARTHSLLVILFSKNMNKESWKQKRNTD